MTWADLGLMPRNLIAPFENLKVFLDVDTNYSAGMEVGLCNTTMTNAGLQRVRITVSLHLG